MDFIEEELGFDKSKNILDIGCGTGRHAIELAKRGHKVTGVDLSKSQLERAKEKTAKAKLGIKFIQKDARQLEYEELFDVVIMICEGAFPLMATDEMNFKILQNAAKALKKDGKFILTTLNALFILYHTEEKPKDSSQNELLKDYKGPKSFWGEAGLFAQLKKNDNRIIERTIVLSIANPSVFC